MTKSSFREPAGGLCRILTRGGWNGSFPLFTGTGRKGVGMSIPGHSAGKPPLDREVIYPGKYQQGSESEDGAMKCSNCGYENGDEAVFCLNCGEKIGNKSEGTLHGPHPSTPKT